VTIFDPWAGRAYHFLDKSAWEWTTEPRIDARVELRDEDHPGRGSRSDRAVVRLVVRGDDRFDPATLDAAGVRLAGAAPSAAPGGPGGHVADLDGDGFPDRLFHFAGGEVGGGDILEFRARTRAGLPVVGFARRGGGTARPKESGAPPDLAAVSPPGPTALSVHMSRGTGSTSATRVVVEGGTAGALEISVYDVRGRLVGSVRHERGDASAQRIELPGESRLGPGIAFVRVRSGDEVRVIKHIVLDR
jgi:hypothetical protein